MSSHRLSGPPTGPHAALDLGHGTNPAMWTACAIGFVAACIATVGSIWPSILLWIVAAVVAVLAFVVLAVMNRMGLGQYTNKEGDSAEDSPTVGIT